MPNPTNPTNPNPPKHLRSFWPIVIILVIAFILCGLILYAANNNKLQDDIDSTNLSPAAAFLKKITPKSPQKTTTKKPATSK